MNTISDYLYQKASVNKIPLGGTLELSPVCNFRCKMCYVRKTPAQLQQEGKQLIPAEKWLSLAQKLREAGTLYLLLTGGEPFVYPNFRELFQSLHRMGFLLSVNTNASMIDAETMKWLKETAPTRMNITLYGASRETYGRICGNEDGYDRTVQAIHYLKEAGIPIVMNASMIPENEVDLEKLYEFGRSLDINTRISTYMFPPVRREREASDSRFTPQEAAKMFLRRSKCQFSPKALEEMFRKQQAGGDEDWGTSEECMHCRAGRSSFFISWEGKMTACGLFPFPLVTDPFEKPFAQCWSELTEQVRTVPVLKQCRNCPLRQICCPCAATVHAECGDVNGKAEYLCQMAKCISEEMSAYLKEVQHED